MSFESIKAREKACVAQTYGRYQVALASGRGARCVGVEGENYIDFTSGIGVNALGYCDEGWIQAVTGQLNKLQHASNLFYTEPMIQAAEMLTQRTGMARVFFANSGAEANEGAIKTARKYSFDKYGQGRATILSLKNSFHGRTVTTLAATGQEVFHNYFFPFTQGFAYAPANNTPETLAMLTDDVCAVMMEMVQGEGGVVPLNYDYVQAVAAACAQKDILVIVDEVQTGMGRTGTLFAYQQFDIQPDLVSAAKGLGGGLPIGAVLLGEKTKDTLGLGQHGTTFGGNPVVCAGACQVLRRMDGAFLQNVCQMGAYLRARLEAMPGVEQVSGLGMMLGVSLAKGEAKQVAAQCAENGLLILTAKEKLRLLPPLNIDREEVDQGLAILENVLDSL